jgi:hypothetical protein
MNVSLQLEATEEHAPPYFEVDMGKQRSVCLVYINYSNPTST